MPLSKTDKQDWAETLFLDVNQKMSNKEIAERVKVRPNTISAWIKKFGWNKKRQSQLILKPKMIADLYVQLECLNDSIKCRPITYNVPDYLLRGTKLKNKNGDEEIHYQDYNPSDYPIKIGNFATSTEANQIAVITKSIKQLETETSIAEIYEVSIGVLEYLKPQDFDLYKKLVPVFDGYINYKMK